LPWTHVPNHGRLTTEIDRPQDPQHLGYMSWFHSEDNGPFIRQEQRVQSQQLRGSADFV
jgi:hypothetical protein